MKKSERDSSSASRIIANRGRFDELVARAEEFRHRGQLEDAAAVAQVAAALAWHSPTGLFASDRLESCLLGIAGHTIAPADKKPWNSRIRTVLHVLTTAYRVGGHTRLAARWIERDDGRVHSVALTRQGDEPVPASLREAVRARGGEVHRIDHDARKLIGRASILEAGAARADLVVLHTHPYDVVPSIALASLDQSGCRPPTILLNHADHVFWIGLSASDLIVHLRASGARLSFARRSLPPERSAILPVPLGQASHLVRREDSRRALGYSESEVLAVSIASGYKFGTTGGDSLLPILEGVVERRPDLRVLAIGPGDRPDWRAAASRTAGWIRSLGNQDDLAPIYSSADIYIDSYPFSSLTSMLEAGQQQIPLVAYSDVAPDAAVLAFDDPATEGHVERPRTRAEFFRALDQLLDDPDDRRERGRRVEHALTAEHTGQGWLAHLERAYARATALHVSPRDRAGLSPVDPIADPGGELDRRLLILLDAQQEDAPRGVRGHLRLAPFSVRVEEWRRSRRTARPLSVFVLLPEQVLRLARRAAILARRLRWGRLARRSGVSRSSSDHGGEPA